MPQNATGLSAPNPTERVPRQSIPATLDPLLREPSRRSVTGLSRSAWYALMQKGEAPKPVSISSGRAVAWRASDLKKWIEDRTQQGAAQ